jgi:hypothetical protein
MGYESCIEGTATGEKLVAQLQEAGFTVEDGGLVDPRGWLTGLVVVDGNTITGTREWHSCYGFDALVQALRRVAGLTAVDLVCRGEEGEHERYVYRDGRWHGQLLIAACVREDCAEAARAAVQAALRPFALPE